MSAIDIDDPEKVALTENNKQKLCNALCNSAIEKTAS